MNKGIPQKVKDAASFLIDLYGDNMQYVGIYQDSEVYEYLFPEDTETGYPILFLYNGTGEAKKITGEKTFKIISAAKGMGNE